MICSIAIIISPVVILSSDTHVARFTTHLGTDSAGIPISDSNSVSYHAPNASEGTKNMIENNAKSDKIILIYIGSDRIVF
jgi:hypothetical protein